MTYKKIIEGKYKFPKSLSSNSKDIIKKMPFLNRMNFTMSTSHKITINIMNFNLFILYKVIYFYINVKLTFILIDLLHLNETN